jgi:hypothetical protein
MGIGASFDTPEHDVQIAQAGLAALARDCAECEEQLRSPRYFRQE